MKAKLVLSALVLVLAAGQVSASFITPVWTRPSANPQAAADQTTFQHWNVFSLASGPNAPDVAEVNPNGAADAFDAAASVSGSFITSGGNIYSPTGIIKPRAIVPGYDIAGNQLSVLVQVESQGAEIDAPDLRVDGVPASTLSDYSYNELSRVALGGFGGFKIEHAWTFTIPDAASTQIDWGWGVVSASVGQILVDTRSVAVPEPSSLACLALAGMAALRRHRLTPRR